MKMPKTVDINGVQYSRVGQLGSGGAGEVSKFQQGTATLAVKFLREVGGEKAKRFERELSFCKTTEHPGIVTIIADGSTDGWRWYAMPIFAGTLRRVIDDKIATRREMVDYILKLSNALSFIHEKGVIHRDLKPENILVDQGSIVIADFGIAHFKNSELTTKSTFLANRDYAAPEQHKRGNATSIGPEADIYALGLIINECFTGALPLGSEHIAIQSVEPLMFEWDDLVRRMTAQDESSRPDINDVITQIQYIEGKRDRGVHEQRVRFEGNVPRRVANELATDSILEQASGDTWFVQHAVWGKTIAQLRQYNWNWHSPLGYEADDFFKNLFAQATILRACERKFAYESNVYGSGSRYIPLNLESTPEHRALYERVQAIVAAHPLEQPFDMSGRILKTFSSCEDYHCEEILAEVEKTLVDSRVNIVDAPLIWLIGSMTSALEGSPVEPSNIDEFGKHVNICWARSEGISIDNLHKELINESYYQEDIDKILSKLKADYSVSVSVIDSEAYSVIFQSLIEFGRFEENARRVSRPYHLFEGDVIDILRKRKIAGGVVALSLSGTYEIRNTLAKVLGLRDDY